MSQSRVVPCRLEWWWKWCFFKYSSPVSPVTWRQMVIWFEKGVIGNFKVLYLPTISTLSDWFSSRFSSLSVDSVLHRGSPTSEAGTLITRRTVACCSDVTFFKGTTKSGNSNVEWYPMGPHFRLVFGGFSSCCGFQYEFQFCKRLETSYSFPCFQVLGYSLFKILLSHDTK